MDRRSFLQSIAAAAMAPAALPACSRAKQSGIELYPDPEGRLDLPRDFRYTVVSRVGDRMSDGLRVPGRHDGMAAFLRDDGTIAIICNHELTAGQDPEGAFTTGIATVPAAIRERIYDRGGDRSPALGGTTTTIWDPTERRTVRQFLSLAGTEINCAGGATPWGTWLSCEEAFSAPGEYANTSKRVVRERRHGYVFEVPADADGLVKAEPLVALGRFEHEAAAVDPDTGVVYLTEDKHDGVFYRLLPNQPGNLSAGGQLQALALPGSTSNRTNNWDGDRDIALREPQPASWIDIDEPDVDDNTLRLRAAASGATTFVRGEGICRAGDRFAFTATEGGPSHHGQVFTYRPVSADSGELELIAEVSPDSIMRYCDNIAAAPWGDLICCEDRGRGSGLVGVRADGTLYRIARNSYTNSELAGACFSPDGETMFVNIQYPGMTLAITGPWDSLRG